MTKFEVPRNLIKIDRHTFAWKLWVELDRSLQWFEVNRRLYLSFYSRCMNGLALPSNESRAEEFEQPGQAQACPGLLAFWHCFLEVNFRFFCLIYLRCFRSLTRGSTSRCSVVELHSNYTHDKAGWRWDDMAPQPHPWGDSLQHGVGWEGCFVTHVRGSSYNFHFWEWSTSNFPCSLTRNNTSHSMENLALHTLLWWKMINNSHYITYTFFYKRLGECTFWA